MSSPTLNQVRRFGFRPERSKSFWGIAACLLGGLLFAQPFTARGVRMVPRADGPGLVTMADGRTLEGEIAEAGDQITVTVSGIATTIPRSQIQSIEYGTPEDRLRRRLAGAGNVQARLEIAEAALADGLLDLATEVARDVQDRDPLNAEASALLDLIEMRRRVERASGTGVRRTVESAAVGPVRPTRSNRLDDEQINLVRQAELQDADARAGGNRPNISFRDGVLKRFTDGQIDFDFREFNRSDDVTKALRILRESREPEMHEDVRIANHPLGIMEYLRRVEPIILNGCATSDCHGGAAAAAFALHPSARDESVSYANFYILNTTAVRLPQAEKGVFDADTDEPRVRRLIDRAVPEQSLLLSYMLPRNKTRSPHPLVNDFNGLVLSSDAPHYQIVRRWITEALGPQPIRGYGFDFALELPASRPTTQPDNQSSAGPQNP